MAAISFDKSHTDDFLDRNPPSLPKDQLDKIADVFNLSKEHRYQQQCFETLYEACKKRNWDLINKVSKESLNEIVNNLGRSLLMEALNNYDMELSSELINRKIAIYTKDLVNNTPLHYSAKTNDREVIAKLLNLITVNEKNYHNQMPLHIAAEYDQPTALQNVLRLSQGDLNYVCNFRHGEHWIKLTPLEIAVIKGHRDCVDVLLKDLKNRSQINLNHQVEKIGNILHLAIYFNQTQMIKHLFNNYKNIIIPLIEDKNSKGLTPFLLACSVGGDEEIIILKEHGVNLQACDNNGKTAIHLSAIGRHQNTTGILLYYGVDIKTEDLEGKRAIDYFDKESKDPGEKEMYSYIFNMTRQEIRLQKEPPVFTYRLPENLVFKGGGPKGLAYVGAMKVLEKEDALRELKRVCGTSAGAINAALLSVGYNASDMEDLLAKTDLKSFMDQSITTKTLEEAYKDFTLSKKIKVAFKLYNMQKSFSLDDMKNNLKSAQGVMDVFKGTKIEELYNSTGVCEGDKFLDWIEPLIDKYTNEKWCTFGDLRKKREENPEKFKHLHVMATRIGPPNDIIDFNSEESKYDNVIISDAVRASMSLPAIFKPHTIHIKDSEGNRIPNEKWGSFMDGGMLNNFPITVFDKIKYQRTVYDEDEGEFIVTNKRTLGFSLYSPNEKEVQSRKNLKNVGDLLEGIISFYYSAEDLMRANNLYDMHRIIEIDNKGVKTWEFGLTDDKKKLLLSSGEKTTTKFYNEQKKKMAQVGNFFFHQI